MCARSTRTFVPCSSNGRTRAAGRSQRPHVGPAARRARGARRSPLRGAGAGRARRPRSVSRTRRAVPARRRPRRCDVHADRPGAGRVTRHRRARRARTSAARRLGAYQLAGRVDEHTDGAVAALDRGCARPAPPGPPPASDAPPELRVVVALWRHSAPTFGAVRCGGGRPRCGSAPAGGASRRGRRTASGGPGHGGASGRRPGRARRPRAACRTTR